MEHSEPREPDPSGHETDPLRRLEKELGRASDAAERLVADAAAKAAQSSEREPPPAGWQAPSGEQPSRQGGDLEVVLQVVQALRELVPPDLERRLGEALRELLLAIRALIDWYLERAERRHSKPPEVQDIPIQ